MLFFCRPPVPVRLSSSPNQCNLTAVRLHQFLFCFRLQGLALVLHVLAVLLPCWVTDMPELPVHLLQRYQVFTYAPSSRLTRRRTPLKCSAAPSSGTLKQKREVREAEMEGETVSAVDGGRLTHRRLDLCPSLLHHPRILSASSPSFSVSRPLTCLLRQIPKNFFS